MHCIVLNHHLSTKIGRGQVVNKLQQAALRHDDVKHRYELLQKAISSNQTKDRSIVEDISKIRGEVGMNEQDLSSAQQLESQTKIRIETIEHEISMERSRHVDAVSNLESKATELTETSAKTSQSIEEKKAMMEAKKDELRKIWEKCTALRKSEGHDVFPEPKWGMEQAPTLDVARVRVRVGTEENDLNGKKVECDSLRKDVADFDALVASNTTKAAEKRTEAEALSKDAEKVQVEEALRKTNIVKAVDEADLECQEVDRLRESIKELTEAQEKNTSDLKIKLENEESNISVMEAEIANTLDELAVVEKQTAEHKEHGDGEKSKVSKDIADVKKTADLVKVRISMHSSQVHYFISIAHMTCFASLLHILYSTGCIRTCSEECQRL